MITKVSEECTDTNFRVKSKRSKEEAANRKYQADLLA
jgi:hypothetical protein